MAGPTALLDANVLYPAGLRDLLLRLADRYLFAPLWSADIHAEWMRSLLADRPDIDAGVLDRTRAVMDEHFPDAVVTGYEAIAAGLDLPDPGDRHVLAAAIHGGADMIVTRSRPDAVSAQPLRTSHHQAIQTGRLSSTAPAAIASPATARAAPRRAPAASAPQCGYRPRRAGPQRSRRRLSRCGSGPAPNPAPPATASAGR